MISDAPDRALSTDPLALSKGTALFALVFGGHLLYLLLTALVSTAVLGGVAFALRGRSDRPWTYAAWAATTTATLFLTLWFRPVGTGAVKCTVSKDVWESFGTTQGWMNVALFVPIGFLGVRAARRPVPPLLLSVLLACAIETFQACLPVIGRYCDTSDFTTNVAGAVVGAGVGVLSLRLAGSRLSPWPTRHRGLQAVTGVGFLAVAVVLTSVVDMRVVDHAEPSRPASAEQRAVIEQAVRKALGDDVRIGRVRDNTPCGIDGMSEEVWAELEPSGVAFMSWPDPDRVRVDVSTGSSIETAAAGTPIPGSTGPVHDAAAAERAAGRYVAVRYPTADTKRPVVDRVDDGTDGTWTATYPYRDDRLRAVTSLQVTVNRAGRLLGVRLAATAGTGPDTKSGASCG
ncbi:VanZ family protein [Streptomyces fagopyri]|uniref:VanZ family protein n=1 Tax=Streptomyces fagopyri TaxID=2662397 RepID=UPI0036B31E0E